MMRGMTFLWAILATAVGVGVFMLKYEVQALEDKLASVNRSIYQNEEAIHVLKAEWSYLNDPTRLRELAERHLAMKPLKPTQIAGLDQLPMNDGSNMLAATPAQPVAPAPATRTQEAKAAAPAAPAKPQVIAKAAPDIAPTLAAAPKALSTPPAPPKSATRPSAPVQAPGRPATTISVPAKPPVLAAPQVSPQVAPLPKGNVLVIKSPAMEAR